MTEEVIDVVDEKPKRIKRTTPKERPLKGAEVAVVESGPLSVPKRGISLLELGLRPEEVVDIGVEIADCLRKIIERPGKLLYTSVKGKKHVHVEGWTTMGAMLGIVPEEVESKRLDDKTWETTIQLKKLSTGMVITKASHICSKKEKMWSNRDEYAIKSMSATRATGKVFRLSFSWIMVLAGYSPTPAEEMQFDEKTDVKAPFKHDDEVDPPADEKPKIGKPDPDSVYVATNNQKCQLAAIFGEAGLFDKTSVVLISQWMQAHELSFKHAGDLVYLLKRYRITKEAMPNIANNLQELDIPQVEEFLITYTQGDVYAEHE